MKYGLLGYPLGHSFSKKYFEEKFKRKKISAQFLNFEIEDISHIKDELGKYPDLKGLSITIPHKEKIIPFLDDMDENAAAINAVNCVKIEDDESWKGFNTDYIGFLESLKPMLLPDSNYKAIILGSGGAAKAVVFALESLNIESKIVSRKLATTNINYEMIDEKMVSENLIIINTTPVGMYPNTNAFPLFSYELLTENHILFDLIYNPEETIFLKKGKEFGAKTQNGLDMLQRQAEAAWAIWNAKK